MALVIDELDPCATARSLRAIYANLVAGMAIADVVFRAGPNGVERRVSYAKADARGLLRLIAEYENQCAEHAGTRRARRFGLINGGRF